MAFAIFALAAAALLGSPGPGVAALVAVGRAQGVRRGLPFLGGMQLGLLIAALVCASGLASLLQAIPGALPVMGVVATAYLLHLAWQIAAAPVGVDTAAGTASPSVWQGFVLGAFNPKAYLALAALMAGHRLSASPWLDGGYKVGLSIAVTCAVDLAWLAAGGAVGSVSWPLRAERAINLAMGGALAAAAVAGLVQLL